MTQLTWCEDCDEDMHQYGGGWCECGCEKELCSRCLGEHRRAKREEEE